jgi:ubiquinone/menaquinone biosynthesis C-methylase UbiE
MKNSQFDEKYWHNFWDNVADKITSSDDYSWAMRQARGEPPSKTGQLYHGTSHNHLIEMLELSSTDIVIDIGCGVGETINQIKDKVEMVYGVDFSEKLIKFATDRFRDSTNVRLITGSADAVPVAAKQFNRIISLAFYHHLSVRQVEKALEEVHRVAQKDCIFIVRVKNSISPIGLAVKLYHLTHPKSFRFGYNRPYIWYRKRLKQIGEIVEESASSFGLPIFPKWLNNKLNHLNKIVFLRGLGREYSFKVRITK